LALNGRQLEREAAQPGQILLAMEELRGPEGKAAE